MKKALFLLLLVPFIGLSQTQLIRWAGYTVTDQWGNIGQTQNPTLQNGTTNMSGSAFSGSGINYSAAYTGFQGNSWPTGDLKNEGKYFQVSIAPSATYKISLSQVNFKIYSEGCKSYEVRYSKNADFSGSSLVTSGTNISTNTDVNVTASMSGINVLSGQTLYLRIYMFKDMSGWGGDGAPVRIRYNVQNGSAEGLNFSGTVGLDSGVTTTADAASVTETQSVNINVLGNDSATNTTFSTVSIFTAPSAGNAQVQTDKSITFTAPSVSVPTDYTFVYKVTGGDNSSANGTVTVTVNPYASPTVTNYTKTTGVGVPVTTNVIAGASAGAGSTIASVTIVSPTNGTATVNNNQVVFNPASAGTTVVTYKVTNNHQKSTNGTITVTAVNVVAATAGADSYTITKNVTTEFNVMANDNIGNSALTAIVVVTPPAHGTASITNTNKITYVPVNGYTGTDTFKYKISNAYNTEATATVSINVVQPSPGTSPLSGTYAVGTTMQYAYTQFTTITAAVNHLNTYGATGPVTFLLFDSSYTNATGETFPITVNSGVTAINKTLTFKPAPGKNVSVTAANPIYYTGVPAVFKLDGADYVTFDGSNAVNSSTRNLTLNNTDYIDYVERSVIWVASNGSDGAVHNTVKYVNLKMGSTIKNQAGKFCVGVYSGNNGIGNNNTMAVAEATANNADLLVLNNDFINVKQGIYINGGSTVSTGITVSQNDLGAEDNTETIIQPTCFHNVNGFTYSENYVYNLYRTTADGNLISAGVFVDGYSSNGNIIKNQMRNLQKTTTESHTFGGVVLRSTHPNTNILVANNFILNVYGQGNGGSYLNGHGIVISSGGGYKIYHNTILLNTNQINSGGYSSALYVGNPGGTGAYSENQNNVTINYTAITNLDVRNNIFANTQTSTGTVRSAITVVDYLANINTVFSQLDYNNYYSVDKFGYISFNEPNNQNANPGQSNTFPGTYYTLTFESWKSLTGKDAHSKNVLPAFASATDLHINPSSDVNAAFTDAGTPAVYSLVTKDIDGQVRKNTAPDMGADEFGQVAAVSPATAGGTANNPGIYCTESTTWNGDVAGWSNGVPTESKDAIFNANFTQTGGTLNACSIYVLAGKSVNFITNSTAIVQHSVNVETTATLTFENNSHLVQVEDDQNSGVVTVKRKTGLLRKLDYTLWSAPVTDLRTATTGTTNNYQSLQEFSPATISNRFYYYNNSNDLYTAYADPATTKFIKGKAVLIRMPNALTGTDLSTVNYNAGTGRVQFEGIFEGTPNTGTIRLPLEFNGGHPFSAVGNPYPSPLNVSAFLQENSVNSNNITGTIWLWRKTNNNDLSSYCTVTLDGYVGNQALNPDGSSNNDGNTMILDPFTLATGGLLNTGQGFIVKTTGAGKELVFRNNMRSGAVHTNGFFKTTNSGDETAAQSMQPDLDGRVWINVKSDLSFSQVLVSYHNYTTDGYDNGYDGPVLTSGNFNLYSLLSLEEETMRLAIQAKSVFTQNDVVPLGYIASAAGTYTFEIDHAEGIFAASQQVYIKDNMLGTIHNLTDGSFTFTTDSGTFNTRFEVVYAQPEELGTDTPVINAKDVIVYRDGSQVKITSTEVINAVTVYDMLGRTLYTKNNIDGTAFTTAALNIAQQVVVVNITLDNNQVISKKIMMN